MILSTIAKMMLTAQCAPHGTFMTSRTRMMIMMMIFMRMMMIISGTRAALLT